MTDRKDSVHSFQNHHHPSFPSSPLCKKPPTSPQTPKNNIGTHPLSFSIFILRSLDLKIIILGNGGVGKTSFIYRYINDNFAETISVHFVPVEKVLKILDYWSFFCVEKVEDLLLWNLGTYQERLLFELSITPF